MYTNISYGKECSYNTFHEIARSSDSLVMRNAAKILLLNIMFKDVYIYICTCNDVYMQVYGKQKVENAS